MSLDRDIDLERALLARAEAAGVPRPHGWTQRVLARLHHAGAEHGDHWTTMSVADLLHEIRDEDLDVGGWGVLAVQRAHADPDLDPATVARLCHLIEQACAHAAAIDELVADAIHLTTTPGYPAR